MLSCECQEDEEKGPLQRRNRPARFDELTRRIATSGIISQPEQGFYGRRILTLAYSDMSRAAEAAMAASYKSLKEDFVSNLTGGEIGEINYVTAVAPVSLHAMNLDLSDLRTGRSNRLVCSTVTAFVLQILRSYLFRRRFSAECWSYSTCHDTLCRYSSSPQHPPPWTRCTHICRASSPLPEESKITTPERDER